MTNPKARERNKAILADSATGKYTAAELAKKYKVSKQHIYNTRSDARKTQESRRDRLAAIAKEVMSDPKPSIKEKNDLLDKLSSSAMEIGKLARTCDEQKRLIDDLLNRNRTLIKVIDRLTDDY